MKKYAYILLFIIGVLLLYIRSLNCITDPILYAEDGKWFGMGLSKGWVYTLFNAREDFFTFIPVALLYLSHLINLAIGNDLTTLPYTISLLGNMWYCCIALLLFDITKKESKSTIGAFLLFLMILLIPLGNEQNGVFGRIFELQYSIPLFSIILFYYRAIYPSYKNIFDCLLVIAAATFPVVFVMTFIYILLQYDYQDSFVINFKNLFNNNLAIIISFLVMALFLLPNINGVDRVMLPYNEKNCIEFLTARSILYPYIAFCYNKFNNTLSIIFTIVYFSIIFYCYKSTYNKRHKNFIIYILLFFILYIIITIISRFWLTSYLDNYTRTFPDRYYYGINYFSVFLLMFSICIVNKTKIKKLLFTVLIILIYFNSPTIFDFNKPKQVIATTKMTFKDQIEIAEHRGSQYVIPIYPSRWSMVLPAEFFEHTDNYKNYVEYNKKYPAYSVFEQWILTQPLQNHNCAVTVLNNSIVLSSLGINPYIYNIETLCKFEQVMDSTVYIKMSSKILYRSGVVRLFYTTMQHEEFSELKSIKIDAEPGSEHMWLFSFPVTKYTKLRLDIPENSSLQIFSFSIQKKAEASIVP